MNFGVLGTGIVGRTIAEKLVDLGHDVTIGTRDVDALLARTEPDARGGEPYASWKQKHPQVRLGTFAAAAGAGRCGRQRDERRGLARGTRGSR